MRSSIFRLGHHRCRLLRAHLSRNWAVSPCKSHVGSTSLADSGEGLQTLLYNDHSIDSNFVFN